MTSKPHPRSHEMLWNAIKKFDADQVIDSSASSITHLALERYWNDGSPSGYHPAVPPKYSPKSKNFEIEIPVFRVSLDSLTSYGKIPSDLNADFSNNFGLLPLHPLMLEKLRSEMISPFNRPPDIVLRGQPTASVRTVAIGGSDDNISYYLKLHYPGRLGRFERDLRLYKWLPCFERSDFATEAHEHTQGKVLREYAGGYWESPNGAHGFICREIICNKRKNTINIPAFSLWAKPPIGQKSIICAVASRLSCTPLDLATRISEAIVTDYWIFALQFGLLLELNAQNLVVSFDLASGKIIPFYRDMQDVFVDAEIREVRQLKPSAFAYKKIDRRSEDLFKRRSFAFDFKLGQYVLAPLFNHSIAKTKNKVTNTSAHIERIRQISRKHLIEFPDYFKNPLDWYSYPNIESASRSMYVRNENPIYR